MKFSTTNRALSLTLLDRVIYQSFCLILLLFISLLSIAGEIVPRGNLLLSWASQNKWSQWKYHHILGARLCTNRRLGSRSWIYFPIIKIFKTRRILGKRIERHMRWRLEASVRLWNPHIRVHWPLTATLIRTACPVNNRSCHSSDDTVVFNSQSVIAGMNRSKVKPRVPADY